ncbi:MAG: hypothetical protein DI529_17950, partial [Chryseobacterium sp.]
YGGPDGDYAAMSTSWYNPAGASNDWLISPQIALPAAVSVLKWDAKAQDADYPDGYKVMLSTNGGNTVADFTVQLYSTAAENSTWTSREVSLAAYVGQTVRIAFVNNSNDMFVLLVDNIKVESAPTAPPNCPSITAPTNGATDVVSTSPVTLTWAASAGATSYDVFLDTNTNPTTLLGNYTTTTTSSTLLPSTTYYWKVVAKNGAGDSTGCTVYSFTTGANPAAPYCGPLAFTFTVEPITLVNFAGINNTTSASTTGGTSHEFFLGQIGNVTQGGTHTITLKGNTGGNYTNYFAVFIDWNQDGDFADSGETYSVGTIVNSTGTDTKQLTFNITVPVGATIGNTRMRVKKQFGTTSPLTDPCAGASFGQAEDYTLNVGILAVSETSKSTIKSYPNPVKDIFNIEAQGKIQSVKVFDVTGKQLLTKELNEVKSQIDFSKFNAGVYVVTTTMADGSTSSTKVIKK